MLILRLTRLMFVQAVCKADQLTLELRMLKEPAKESESRCEDENYRIREEQLRLEKLREERYFNRNKKEISFVRIIIIFDHLKSFLISFSFLNRDKTIPLKRIKYFQLLLYHVERRSGVEEWGPWSDLNPQN